jgi:hypothetical protein
VFIIGGLENFLNIYNQFSYTLNLFTNLITSRASILSIFQSFEMCRVLNFITLFQKACVFKRVWVRYAICHPYSVRCTQHLRIEHGLFLSIYCAHVCWPQRACRFPLSNVIHHVHHADICFFGHIIRTSTILGNILNISVHL